ncbi:MAG: cytochrome C oxidase subunit IV family protein [Elusimicrobia bacterium]|nr:cytochrome C oxidase subunit IV family protein [Elusimicrobiota bacterium]
MNQEHSTHSDDALDLGVYLSLLALTVATLAASRFTHGGRIMAVVLALIIASVKASLIGFYYMGLRRERAMMFIILGIGAVAVGILVAGILPDLTFARF